MSCASFARASARAGSSGTGRLDVTGSRPRLDVRLTAPSIQLDDFPLPERLTDDPPTPLTAAGVRATARNVARQTERLLSAGFLRRLDAHLDVEVREVLSGTDHLADGVLRIQVIDGRLAPRPGPGQPARRHAPAFGRVRPDRARGRLRGRCRTSSASTTASSPAACIERRACAAFSVSTSSLPAGRPRSIRSCVTPTAEWISRCGRWTLPAGIFNFWSVNLLLAVLPVIDPGGKSHVNCIVGRFDLKDGVLSDDKIMIDTTRVRVRGAGSANLRTEELAFVFRPRAKGLALFRLQTRCGSPARSPTIASASTARDLGRIDSAHARLADPRAARAVHPGPAAARRCGRVHRSAAGLKIRCLPKCSALYLVQ